MSAAWELPLFKIPALDAAVDLSSSYGYAVALNTSGQLILPAAAGNLCIGIVRNKPKQGQCVELWFQGVCPATAGGAVSPSNLVATNSSGQLVVATTGQHVVGIAMTAASGSGSLFSVLLTPGLVA